MKTEHTSALSAAEANRGDRRQNTSILRKWCALALGGFLFTSIFALSAPLAEAQCQQWNLGHGWQLKQGPTTVHMSLRQEGTRVTGTAKFFEPKSKKVGFFDIDDSRNVSGKVIGTVNGDTFTMRIVWNNNTVGIYNGAIDPSGKMDGTAYEARSASTRVKWRSETTMICRDAAPVQPTNPAPPPAAPPPKVIKGSGTARPQTQASAATPTITANSLVVRIGEGQIPQSIVTWDAGPAHPRAQVARKCNNDPQEVIAITKSKGSQSMLIKPGTNVFSLVEYGSTLASVTVTAIAPPGASNGGSAPFTPTQGEAGKATLPYIRALPQIVSLPRDGSEAFTKLVWFAGNDHPDARLVVEVNGGDETLVDPQRKGSRQVKVKAGRKYVYSLVDAGEPLASVVVQTDQSAGPPERMRGNQRAVPQDAETKKEETQEEE